MTNHKYVTREWKNGKWIYTYNSPGAVSNRPGDKQKMLDTEKSSNEYVKSNDRYKEQSQKYNDLIRKMKSNPSKKSSAEAFIAHQNLSRTASALRRDYKQKRAAYNAMEEKMR